MTTFKGALDEQWWSLSTDALAYLTLMLVGWALAAYDRASQSRLRESRLEAELARAQLEALRLEVQPHFLFNTLNSIASLIRVDAGDRALDMLVRLGDLMRTTLERPKVQLVTLGSELDFTKRYIELQQARFADRLEVEYAIADGSEAWTVPSFVLQPLVENAFRHGLGRRSGVGLLQIGSRVERGCLRVWVVDDGGGLPAGFSLPRDAGTGLGNIWSRLEHLYGGAASLTVRAGESSGTIVELLLPA
jgi:LytS/YehU family sensor histidine kinase